MVLWTRVNAFRTGTHLQLRENALNNPHGFLLLGHKMLFGLVALHDNDKELENNGQIEHKVNLTGSALRHGCLRSTVSVVKCMW